MERRLGCDRGGCEVKVTVTADRVTEVDCRHYAVGDHTCARDWPKPSGSPAEKALWYILESQFTPLHSYVHKTRTCQFRADEPVRDFILSRIDGLGRT